MSRLNHCSFSDPSGHTGLQYSQPLNCPCPLPCPHCRVHGLEVQGRDCGEEAAQWITSFLKTQPCRLVHFEPHMNPRRSQLLKARFRPTDHVSGLVWSEGVGKLCGSCHVCHIPGMLNAVVFMAISRLQRRQAIGRKKALAKLKTWALTALMSQASR